MKPFLTPKNEKSMIVMEKKDLGKDQEEEKLT